MRFISQSPVPAYILKLLQSLRCGGVLLDFRGRVLSLNMLALGCLGDGLVLGGEHLSAIDSSTDLRLQRLVGSALSKEDLQASMSVAVPRHARLPLMIRTLRLEDRAAESAGSPRMLLLVHDPELWPEPQHEILSQAFGLTRSEAEVAIGVASGRTLATIAAGRGVKIGTVRVHLKTVFSKTHTRGQADLTRVVTRLSFLMPQPD
jgi:DNA-binding CsgD family transcriptional regulator